MEEPILQSWESLEKLQGVQFFKLYRQPASALAIFRKRLTNLAKAFVMILLYMPSPLPSHSLDLFVKEGSAKEREHALFLLQKYHIFNWMLTPEFARSLRIALTGGKEGSSYFGKVKDDLAAEDRMEIQELDDYARDRWEGILGFMVNSSEVLLPGERRPQPPSAFVIKLLQGGGLIELTGTASRGQTTTTTTTATVTKEGFAFVLQDINTQLWALLFLYVDSAGSLQMDPVDVLSFLFLVSSLELGVAYSTDGFDAAQLTMLQHLEELGIIYWPKTNYRFYAYTNSPLQIALINLFVRISSRHPNLITGKLTKTSLTVLPATVIDQIHLWQLERDRMTTTPGYLLKDFANQSEYEAPCTYADEIGVLVWKSDHRRIFFVSRIEQVRDFMAIGASKGPAQNAPYWP
ncbi:hypothetical protein DV738_g632, partial [Chaetothyriales sp. CBS 135597]